MREEQKKPRTLTEAQRLARVFSSQGRATRLADHLPEKFKKRVAALCGLDGIVSPTAPKEFVRILREMGQEQKAAVAGLTEADESKATVGGNK